MPGFDEWFDQNVATVEESAPADETAIEAAAHAEESTPGTDETPVEAVQAEPVAEPEPVVETAPPAAPEPVVPVWDSPDNPYYAEVQRHREAAARLERLQAEKLRAERVKGLADDDPMRAREIAQFVAEQQTPLVQEVEALKVEANQVSKLATVLDETVRLFAPPELVGQIEAEVKRVMALNGGPELIRADLHMRKSERDTFQTQLAALQAQNAELQKQLDARNQLAQRAERGADVVDSQTGATGLSPEQRLQEARGKGFDSFFDTWASGAGIIPA